MAKSEEQLELEKLMPKALFDKLAQKKIVELYPPQVKAIAAGITGDSIFVSVPTAAGKTLIAIMIIMDHFLKHQSERYNHKIIYLTPLKALAREKFQEFKDDWGDLGITVRKAVSDPDRDETSAFYADLIIMTNEKADSMLRGAPHLMKSVSLVVCDEIHLMNDQTRGATLEILLSRFKKEQRNVQIVGLSATVSNYNQLAEWLNAKPIIDDFRPVPYKKQYYIPNTLHELIKEKDGTINEIIRYITPIDLTKSVGTKDKLDTINTLAELVLDTLSNGGQCLIFTNSRKSAMNYAKRVGSLIQNALDNELLVELDRISTEFLSLNSDVTGLAKDEAECIRQGVVFHHAGLVENQQKKIEDAFKSRKIKVIIATPTLAAGVNTPARRVIIQTTKRFDQERGGNVAIPIMEFQQMAGRAGRPGYDKEGDVVVLSGNNDIIKEMSIRYYFSPPEMIISKLSEKSQFESHILGAIASKMAKNKPDLLEFLRHTFYFYQSCHEDTKNSITNVERMHITTKPTKNKKPDLQKSKDLLDKRRAELAKLGRGRNPLSFSTDFVSASELMDEYADADTGENEEFGIGEQGELGEQGKQINLQQGSISEADRQNAEHDMRIAINRTLSELEMYHLIENQDETIIATDFGKIAFEMYIKPATASVLMEKLIRAYNYHEDGELVYSPATWLYIIGETEEYKSVKPTKDVFQYIVMQAASYHDKLPIPSIPNELQQEFNRFSAIMRPVMALEHWIQEVNEPDVCDRFDIHSGDLNYYINIACWLTRCLLRFAKAMGYKQIVGELKDFETRLRSGIKEELLPLVKIKGIGRKRARLLFNGGFKTIEDIKKASDSRIMTIPGFSSKLIANMRQSISDLEARSQRKKSTKKTTKKTSSKASTAEYIEPDDSDLDDNNEIGKDVIYDPNEKEGLATQPTTAPGQETESQLDPDLESELESESESVDQPESIQQSEPVTSSQTRKRPAKASQRKQTKQTAKVPKTDTDDSDKMDKSKKSDKKGGSLLDFI